MIMKPLKHIVISLGVFLLGWFFSEKSFAKAADLQPKVQIVKVGTQSFYRLPSGLEVSIICEEGKDTLSVMHPKRQPLTFSSTAEKVVSFQIVESQDGVEISHIDKNGDGIPDHQISRKGVDEIKIQKIELSLQD